MIVEKECGNSIMERIFIIYWHFLRESLFFFSFFFSFGVFVLFYALHFRLSGERFLYLSFSLGWERWFSSPPSLEFLSLSLSSPSFCSRLFHLLPAFTFLPFSDPSFSIYPFSSSLSLLLCPPLSFLPLSFRHFRSPASIISLCSHNLTLSAASILPPFYCYMKWSIYTGCRPIDTKIDRIWRILPINQANNMKFLKYMRIVTLQKQ